MKLYVQLNPAVWVKTDLKRIYAKYKQPKKYVYLCLKVTWYMFLSILDQCIKIPILGMLRIYSAYIKAYGVSTVIPNGYNIQESIATLE